MRRCAATCHDRSPCRNAALPESDHCAQHHAWRPGERGDAPYRVTRDGLIDLGSVWYRSGRVVDLIHSSLDPRQRSAWLTGNRNHWASRRWYEVRTSSHTRLLAADRLLTYLGLHLSDLGDPDVCSSVAPSTAIREGYSLVAYHEAVRRAAEQRHCSHCGAPNPRGLNARYCSQRCARAARTLREKLAA